jgi:hypothetical protein
VIYLLASCRVATGLVFTISSLSKARNIAQFQQAIFDFHLFSRRLSNLAALLFLYEEFASGRDLFFFTQTSKLDFIQLKLRQPAYPLSNT